MTVELCCRAAGAGGAGTGRGWGWVLGSGHPEGVHGDLMGAHTHGSDHGRRHAVGRSRAVRVCEWERGQGMGMGWGEWVVQAHAREWEWVQVREQHNDACIITADRGWRQVGVKTRTRVQARSRRGDGVAIVVTVFVIDEGVGLWGRPVGAPG